jgi:hypothetical protein
MKRMTCYALAAAFACVPMTAQAGEGPPTQPEDYGLGKAFIATLTGAQENPNPVTTDGMGYALLTFKERPGAQPDTLCVALSFAGLSGPAVAAHVHGPADPDENAPPFFFLSTTSPVNQCQDLTNDQKKALKAGRLYLNVHTEDHPGGEIRGQILPIVGPNYKDPDIM